MLRVYTIFGVVMCLFLGFANYRGWRAFNDFFFSNTWDPRTEANTRHK